VVTGAPGSYMRVFLGGNKPSVSLARVFHGSHEKSPGALQAVEMGTGIAHKWDADAAALGL